MNICLFSQDEISRPLCLKDERAEHLIKILHKKEGDSFSAGIINGKAGRAFIKKITTQNIEFAFTAESEGKPLYPVKMIIGFPRPIQLKRLLRDIAALGISQVHLTGTELGEKSYMKSNLVEQGTAYRMLLEGSVQAAGTYVPELFMHQTLRECLAAENKQKDALLLALDNINPKISLMSALKEYKKSNPPQKNIVAAIGSERGWTENERRLLEENGFIRCGMGPRVMRTETAATVSAAVISAECGWLE